MSEKMHKVVNARVVPWAGGVFGIALDFDDRRRRAYMVGSEAEAQAQVGTLVGTMQPVIERDCAAAAGSNLTRRSTPSIFWN